MASSSPVLRALGAAWRSAREALSHSSTIVRHETGSHLLRIDNYSRVTGSTSAAALPGYCIKSARFFVGGHDWQLHFYPNGADESASRGHASVKLVLTGDGPWWLPTPPLRDGPREGLKERLRMADGSCLRACKFKLNYWNCMLNNYYCSCCMLSTAVREVFFLLDRGVQNYFVFF
jgi:hypothetical protein